MRALGFLSVVDLRDVSTKTVRDDIAVHSVANRDGDAWSEADVESMFKFIHDTILRGKVLVACAAGQSRSVSAVVGYLVRCGWDLPSAWRVVKEARPQAAPVKVMLEAVLKGAVK